jgi:hypothetical protein
MKHIFVRPAEERDIPQFKEWSNQNPNFDARSAAYPSSIVLAAYDARGAIAFLPVQQPFYMEAMSFRPDATEFEKGLAMKELTHALITASHARGVGEVYFLGSNKETNNFAEKQGFEELPWRAYRIKLNKLEGLP